MYTQLMKPLHLSEGFERHLEQTKTHAQRLGQILQALGETPKGKKCRGMQGIVAEGKEILDEDYEGSLSISFLCGRSRIFSYRLLRRFR